MLVSLVFAAYGATAQESFHTVGRTEGGLSVNYLLQTGNSTLLYCSYASMGEAGGLERINLSRNASVISDGIQYAVTNSFNMPIKDEAYEEWAVFRYPGQVLNFVLEFDQFDDSQPFDLVLGPFGASELAVAGILADSEDSESIDTKSFIEATPFEKYGQYVEDSKVREYYEREGVLLFLTMGDIYTYMPTEDYFAVGIDLVNKSSSPVSIDPSTFTASGEKRVGKRIKPYKPWLMTKEECDKVWYKMDQLDAIHQSGPSATNVVHSTISSAAFSTNDPLIELGAFALGFLFNEAEKSDISPYMEEMAKAREEGMNDYLVAHTVNPGESYYGFLGIGPADKWVSTRITVTINGIEYPFDILH